MRNKRLGEATYERIRSGIVDGTYRPGVKLPSEARLCVELDVSRPVVREALARLRVEGLIVSRQGSGTFVRERADGRVNGTAFAPVKNLRDIDQCFDFRLALEGEAAFHAARNRGEPDLAAIQAMMNKLARAAETGATGDADDFGFHIAVAEATRIHFFASVISSMRLHVVVGMKLAEELSRVGTSKRLRLVESEHQAVFDAIRAQEPEHARDAMRHHIDSSRRRLFLGND